MSALAFFGSILLHGSGMRGGGPQRNRDLRDHLWLFGGVAKHMKDTESPGVEFRVAAAGPAVTC